MGLVRESGFSGSRVRGLRCPALAGRTGLAWRQHGQYLQQKCGAPQSLRNKLPAHRGHSSFVLSPPLALKRFEIRPAPFGRTLVGGANSEHRLSRPDPRAFEPSREQPYGVLPTDGRHGGYSISSKRPNNFRNWSRKPNRTSPPVSVCFSVRMMGLAWEV